jgi:D-alanyl-D-alanine carboxypeptidase
MLIARVLVSIAIMAASPPAEAQRSTSVTQPAASLLHAYPEFLDRIEGNDLIWKDGTRMPVDDGKGTKTFDALLDSPDIKDMFAMTYPLGRKGIPPNFDFDPGRVRYLPMFTKMYGDCRTADFMRNAADVTWLPSKDGKHLRFSRINGAAAALQRVSNELDKLARSFLVFLRPTQGTYNCRAIAGTNRASAHSYGAAIDIASAHSHYWYWTKPDADGHYAYRNEIPWEVVEIFERHGFVWGGKWYHYDTMHFEYRPEIVAAGQ